MPALNICNLHTLLGVVKNKFSPLRRELVLRTHLFVYGDFCLRRAVFSLNYTPMAIAKKSDRVPDPEDLAFADLLREARTRKRLSQRELGEQVGIWNTYIGQIEKGEKVPSDEICKKFAEVLELDLTQVLLAAYEARTELTGSDEAIALFKRMKLVLSDPVVQRLLDADEPIDSEVLAALANADIRRLLAEEVWRERMARCYRIRSKRNILALLALVESMTDKQWKAMVNMLDAMGLEMSE